MMTLCTIGNTARHVEHVDILPGPRVPVVTVAEQLAALARAARPYRDRDAATIRAMVAQRYRGGR